MDSTSDYWEHYLSVYAPEEAVYWRGEWRTLYQQNKHNGMAG